MGSKSKVDPHPDPPSSSSTNAPPPPPAGKREAADNVVAVITKKQKLEIANNLQVEVPPSTQSATTAASDMKNSSISNEPKDEDIDIDSSNKEDDQRVRTSVEVSIETTTLDANRESISNEYEKAAGDDSLRHLKSPLKSGTRSTIVRVDNLSLSTTEEDLKIFFKNVGEVAQVHFDTKGDHFAGHGHVEFTTAEAADEALKLNNELLLDHPVRLDLVTEKAEPTSLSSVSKTLFLGNLSFSVEEDDVRGFFKDVGEIAELNFAIRDDRFLGWARVEFTTAEAAQEALKLNNQLIHDRRVKIELARERGGAYTRGSSRMDNFSQRGGETQVKSVYVRGFKSSDGYDNIRIALIEHFEKCGEITRLAIPKDLVSGAPRGVAFIDFAGNYAFGKALRLNGSEFGGSKLVVEEAKTRFRGEGSGYGFGDAAWVRESGSASGGGGRGYVSGRETSGCRTESGSGRESGSGCDWRSSRRGGYGNISWHSERSYGGSWWGTSGSRESGSSSGGYSGGSWGRANAFSYGAIRAASPGFGGGWGWGNGSSGSWGRGNGSSGVRSVGSGYSGRGFSSSHVGRFSGSYGNSRGRGPRGS